MTIKCHFDGRVIVPDEPVDLPLNQPLVMTVQSSGVVFMDPPDGKPGTAEDLLPSEVVGMWRGRKDIENSLEFARRLRLQAERRDGGRVDSD